MAFRVGYIVYTCAIRRSLSKLFFKGHFFKVELCFPYFEEDIRKTVNPIIPKDGKSLVEGKKISMRKWPPKVF